MIFGVATQYNKPAVPATPAKIYYIEDFGARANDGFSDSVEISFAINYVFQNGGGSLMFKEGRYQ